MSVVTIRNAENCDAVATLEEALEKAKSGEIKAVGIAWVTKNDGISGVVSAGQNQIAMSAALNHVTQTFYLKNIN